MRPYTLAGLLSLSIAASGCGLLTRQPELASTATRYNLQLEQAQNEAILLNIVRASLYRPKHFSAITQFRRTSSGEVSAGVTLPLGGGSDEKYVLSPSLKVPDPASMDVVPLDSREFIRGIYAPIDLQTLSYFLKQGWPRELVWRLMIREIRFDGEVVKNDGENAVFVEKLRELLACGLDVVEFSESVGPPMDPASIDAAKIVASSAAGFSIAEVQVNGAPKIVLRKPVHRAVHFTKPADENAEPQLELFRSGPAPESASGPRPYKAPAEVSDACQLRSKDGGSDRVLILRSTEGLIHYLGRLVANQDSALNKITDSSGSARQLLLLSQEDKKPKETFVRVEYENKWYSIATKSQDYSGTILGIVSALIGLHKQQQDLPRTGVVQVTSSP